MKQTINLNTGSKRYITTKKGLEVLEKYDQKAGSSECGKYNNEPIKCHAHKTSNGTQCLYRKKGNDEGVCYKKSSRMTSDDELLMESDRRRSGSVSNQFKKSARNMFKKSLDKNKIFNISKNDRKILKNIKEEDKKQIIKHCIPCTEDNLNMEEWDNRDCDECIGEDETMKTYFDRHPEYSKSINKPNFLKFKQDRQKYEENIRNIQEEKIKQMELAHTKQLCKSCDSVSNIDSWDENSCTENCLEADEAFGYSNNTFKTRRETFKSNKINEENEKKIKLAVLRTKCEPCLDTNDISDWNKNNCDICLEEDLTDSFAEKNININLNTFTEMKKNFEKNEKLRLEKEQQVINEIKNKCEPCNSSNNINNWIDNDCDPCIGKDKILGLNDNTLKNKKSQLEIQNQKEIIRHAGELASKKAQCEPCLESNDINQWNDNNCKQCLDDKTEEALQLSNGFLQNKLIKLEKEQKKREHEKKVFLATQKAQCEPCYNSTDKQQWEENNCEPCLEADEAFGQSKGYMSNKKEQFVKNHNKIQKEREIKLATQKAQCEPCLNSDSIEYWNEKECSNCSDADESLGLEKGTLLSLKSNLEEKKKAKDDKHKENLKNKKLKCEPCYNSTNKEDWDKEDCDQCLDADEAFGQNIGYMKEIKKNLVKKYLNDQLTKQLRLKEKEMTCEPCLSINNIEEWNSNNCDPCIDDETSEIFNLNRLDIEEYKNSLVEKDKKNKEEEELRKVTVRAKCEPCINSEDIDNWKTLNCDECLNSDLDINQNNGFMSSKKDSLVTKRMEEKLAEKIQREESLAKCNPCIEVSDINEWNNLNCDQCLENNDWVLKENIHVRNTKDDNSDCDKSWCLECAGLECKNNNCVSPNSDTPDFHYTPNTVKKRLKNNKKSRKNCKKERIRTFSELKTHFEKMEELRLEEEELTKRKQLEEICSTCTNSENIDSWNSNDCDQCIGQEEKYDSNLESGQIEIIKNKLEEKKRLELETEEILAKCSNCGTENQSIDDWNDKDCDYCIDKDDVIYNNNPNKGLWKIGNPLPKGYNTLEMYKKSRQDWEDNRKKNKSQCDPCLLSENIENWETNNCDQCLDMEKEYDNDLEEGGIRQYKNDLIKEKQTRDEVEKVGLVCKDKCSDQISIDQWNKNDCDYCIDKDEIMMAHYNSSPGWKPGDDIPDDYQTFKNYKKSRQDWEDKAKILNAKCSPCLESNDLSNWEDNNCDQCIDEEKNYDSDLELGDINKFKNKLIHEENQRRLQEELEEKRKRCSPCKSVDSMNDWERNDCDLCLTDDNLLSLEANTLLAKKMDLQIEKHKNDKRKMRTEKDNKRIRKLYSLPVN